MEQLKRFLTSKSCKDMIRTLLYVLMGLIGLMWMTSCSSNYHLKKSKYHLERAKAKGAVIQKDTVYADVPLITPEVKTDTVFKDVGDTITIVKDKLKIKYVRDLRTDTVYIEGSCEADTVIKKVPVTIQDTVYIEKSFFEYLGVNKWWEKALLILLVLVVLDLLLRRR